jgi:hypothetical protein
MASSNGINQQANIKIFSEQGCPHVVTTKHTHHSSHKNINIKNVKTTAMNLFLKRFLE